MNLRGFSCSNCVQENNWRIFYTSNTEPQGGEIQSALNSSSAAPPAYTPGDTARSGYTAQPGYTVQQPGYPPKQQPYLAQPGYPLQTFSTVSMQVSDCVIN